MRPRFSIPTRIFLAFALTLVAFGAIALGVIASFGVIAQWLEAHKKLEAWIGWMAVNIAGIGVYAAIGLYWFVGLYGLYLVLSFTGFWRWQADRARSLEQA